MKNSFSGETRLHFQPLLVPSSKCFLPRAMVSPRSSLAMASARSGPRLGNALQVTTAPGQQVTQRRTSLKAKGKARARRAIGALLLLPIANVRLRLLEPSLLLPKLGAIQSASEENLLQAKLIDLLAGT